MNGIPVVNIGDEKAASQMADIIRFAALNALVNGEIEESDLDGLDVESVAADVTKKLQVANIGRTKRCNRPATASLVPRYAYAGG